VCCHWITGIDRLHLEINQLMDTKVSILARRPGRLRLMPKADRRIDLGRCRLYPVDQQI